MATGSTALDTQSQQQYQQAQQGYAAAASNYGATQSGLNTQYQDLYNQQAQYGASQKLALQQQYQTEMAQNQQSMLAAGLGNSTVLQAGARGVNYDYANSLLTLNDQLYQRQNAIKQAQLQFGQAGAQSLAQLQQAGPALAGTASQNSQQLAGQEYMQQQQLAQNYQLAVLQGNYAMQMAAMQNAQQAAYRQVPVTENYEGGGGGGGGGGGAPGTLAGAGNNLANMTQYGSASNPSGYVDSSVSGDSSPSYYGYSGY